PLADQVDVFLRSREKEPARTRLISLRICPQGLRRVAVRIDADGVKKDVPPNTVSQHVPHLREPSGFERTRIDATGVEELDHEDLVLQKIVIEADLGPELCRQLDVGEVLDSSASAIVGRHWSAIPESCDGSEQSQNCHRQTSRKRSLHLGSFQSRIALAGRCTTCVLPELSA